MQPYVFLQLRRQLGKSTLAMSGFLLVACTLILLSATTQTTVVQANQIINQNWRSTYDIVVLSPKARIPPGQNIPADFLEGYDGGISMQQYAQIKQLPGVAVAAPIAYIGYIALPTPKIYFPNRSFPAGYYQLNWTLVAFDGQRDIVEFQESTIYQIFPCAQVYDVRPLDIVLKEQAKDQCPVGSSGSPPILNFATPDTGIFMLAAVDPEAENQLIQLDQSVVSGRMLTEQDTIHQDQRIPGTLRVVSPITHQSIPVDAIPMIINKDLPGQITLTATFTQLLQGILSPEQLRERGGASYLRSLHHQSVEFQGTVPLVQNDPQRFAGAQLVWDGHTWQTLPSSSTGDIFSSFNFILDFSSASSPTSLTYRPAIAPDGEHAYSLVSTGVQGPEGAFRQLLPLQLSEKPGENVVYTFESVGQFAGKNLISRFNNPLNWLPENTYTSPPVTLRYDAQGHSVPPTTLLPTTNRAGYIMQPPLALTTLAAAQQLKGKNCISAIRIRISGVNSANQDSWKRIQQVAGLIAQRTHLQVFVTLGSSPKPTLVYVPGIKRGQFGVKQDIAPVGWVEERWIAVGASLLYLTQLGATRLLLLAAVLAVCLGYLIVAFSALMSAQRTEFSILSALGWRPWQTTRLFLIQALLLALSGGGIGMGIALLLITFLGATPVWGVVAWTLPVVSFIALLSSIYPLWQIWRIQPAEILRAGFTVTSGNAGFFHLSRLAVISPLGSLVIRNLLRSQPRILTTLASLFLSAALLMVMLSSILALHQTLINTLLGSFVLLQTAVPQIAGCVFAVLLTFLNVADLLLLQVRERQREIGLLQAVGWQVKQVQWLFLQEGITLAIIGTLPGVIVALWILLAEHTTQSIIPDPLFALIILMFMVLVAALATLPALRVVSHMPVIDILRAE